MRDCIWAEDLDGARSKVAGSGCSAMLRRVFVLTTQVRLLRTVSNGTDG